MGKSVREMKRQSAGIVWKNVWKVWVIILWLAEETTVIEGPGDTREAKK